MPAIHMSVQGQFYRQSDESILDLWRYNKNYPEGRYDRRILAIQKGGGTNAA